jgi:hypothetical protein
VISVPTSVVIAQWVLLLALALFVVVMYRQLAYLMRLTRNVSQDGLAVGVEAPDFEYEPARQHTGVDRRRFMRDGAPAVLMFAHPGCASCVDALGALEKAATRQIRVLVVTDAEPDEIAAVDAFRESALEIGRVDQKVRSNLYRTFSTPFVYGVGADGVIRTRGSVVNKGEMQRIVRETTKQNSHGARTGG